ncbi:class I SAM-dependent methyltransferase [Neolewinella antarctica]|uniref:2-polyprenyl-6-hydroxyphenyl methylase/3-demethylubiquinone-9 3-methyltransferase n=1 Tax=Neolewinella antarctica TaxID=442734 RepID=A0ABX0X6B9_9BACT|nr:methyltransferase domain-containing protein [Neolewinella antarctica]NJC24747.1 2-polyprenyl-6-hydroxyphenyl methylase/3-demethylubiquinone-9 3-methyltransferase [Neolewinella antarctica]
MKILKKYAALRWKVAQYLEGKWWRRYLQSKAPADYLAEKRTYWERVLDDLDWVTVPNRTVLDAGCGPAGIFTYVRHTERVTALDPLLDNYEKHLAIFSRGAYPDVRFHRQKLEEACVPGGPFGAIYCFNAINHVADWHAALDRLTEYATTGTRMILTSDVHRHGWLLPIFKALPGDALHPQQHDASAYRRALTVRGWRIDWEEVLRRELIFNYTAWVLTYVPNPADD